METLIAYLGDVLRLRHIKEDIHEKGHFLWLDDFGWHDCTEKEDELAAHCLSESKAEITRSHNDPS